MLRHPSILAGLLAAAPLLSCHGPVPEPLATGQAEQAVGEGGPSLMFLPGWVQRVDAGPLVAGREVRLTYAAERLPTCRGTHNGFPAWLITAHYRGLPDDQVREVQLGNDNAYLTRSLSIPEGTTELEMWFSSSASSGRALPRLRLPGRLLRPDAAPADVRGLPGRGRALPPGHALRPGPVLRRGHVPGGRRPRRGLHRSAVVRGGDDVRGRPLPLRRRGRLRAPVAHPTSADRRDG